jgi:hypothetical protein
VSLIKSPKTRLPLKLRAERKKSRINTEYIVLTLINE